MKKFFHVSAGQFGYPQPESDCKLPLTYRKDGRCPTCDFGKEQFGPIRFRKEPKVTNKSFTGLNWIFDEIFLTNAAKLLLMDQNITGVHFSRPVIHRTSEPFTDWHQIQIDTVIENSLKAENLTVENCVMPAKKRTLKFLNAIGSNLVEGPFCGHPKYNYPISSPIMLSCRQLENAPDIFRLAEFFGSGGQASRPIFVSERFVDLYKRHQLRGLFIEEADVQ